MIEFKYKVYFNCGYDFEYIVKAENEEAAIKSIRSIYPYAKLERIK